MKVLFYVQTAIDMNNFVLSFFTFRVSFQGGENNYGFIFFLMYFPMMYISHAVSKFRSERVRRVSAPLFKHSIICVQSATSSCGLLVAPKLLIFNELRHAPATQYMPTVKRAQW